MSIHDRSAVFEEIAQWANETFPGSTPQSKVAHLEREVRELKDDPANGEEIADCVMILIHLADGVGVDLFAELRRKLEINKAREWGQPDAEGVVEHVREPLRLRGVPCLRCGREGTYGPYAPNGRRYARCAEYPECGATQ